jgi:FkbM family methyltransferase
MGYPDAWTWGAAKNVSQASNWIGKCCPVQSGEWIAGWFKRALDGTPGAPLEEIGDREYLHNSTLLYKPWLKEQSGDKPLSIPRRVSRIKIQRQRFDSGVSNKRYDFAKSEHRRLRIKPGDVVLDLGAYVGAYVSVALDAGASHVVAVEANPDAFKIFEEGIGANENVTAVWAAVSEQPGDEVLLYVPRKSGTTMASITRHVGDPVRVPRVSLAELIERYEPDVVKIDIEGAEWELLDAGLKLPGVRALCLEFHRAGAGDDFVGRIRDAFTDMRGRGWTALNNAPKPAPTSKWPTYGFWEAT